MGRPMFTIWSNFNTCNNVAIQKKRNGSRNGCRRFHVRRWFKWLVWGSGNIGEFWNGRHAGALFKRWVPPYKKGSINRIPGRNRKKQNNKHPGTMRRNKKAMVNWVFGHDKKKETMKEETINTNPWIELTVCDECNNSLSYNQIWKKNGTCVYCGAANDPYPFVRCRKVFIRATTNKKWFQFWKEQRYEGKDHFSRQWLKLKNWPNLNE